MQAPRWFILELALFDPALRVRWSVTKQLFQIERKIQNALPIDTSNPDCWSDDYLRARDGYILVCSVHPHGLNRRVMEVLRTNDLWDGGWEKMIREIEERETAEEEKKWADFSDDIKHHSAELWDYMARRNGSRINNVGVPE